MKRRGLLLGALAALATAALPVKAVSRPPVLYGDGVHDDSAALSALMRGESVRMPDGRLQQVPEVGHVHMPPGIYLLNAPVSIVRDNTIIDSCTFVAGPKNRAGLLKFDGVKGCVVSNNRFIGRRWTLWDRITRLTTLSPAPFRLA